MLGALLTNKFNQRVEYWGILNVPKKIVTDPYRLARGIALREDVR